MDFESLAIEKGSLYKQPSIDAHLEELLARKTPGQIRFRPGHGADAKRLMALKKLEHQCTGGG
jgi:hypothetical protein